MSDVFTQTPLHGFINMRPRSGAASNGLQITESALNAYVNIRGASSGQGFLSASENTLGLALPLEPNTFHKTHSRSAFWLGPNEWLIRASDLFAEQIERDLRQQLSGHYSIVDVSGGYTTLTVEGREVVELLKKSCVYDVESMPLLSGASGKAVQTVLAKAGAIVSRHTDDCYELVIRRSFSDYIALWLEDASAEYGGSVRTAETQMA